MVQKRRLVKHSFWVKKTYYLAQRQNLWEYTGTIKNKHKFRMILFGLSRPFQSLWMSPACGQDYLGLPRLTHAYPSSIGLQINNIGHQLLMPMQCSPAVSLFKETVCNGIAFVYIAAIFLNVKKDSATLFLNRTGKRGLKLTSQIWT